MRTLYIKLVLIIIAFKVLQSYSIVLDKLVHGEDDINVPLELSLILSRDKLYDLFIRPVLDFETYAYIVLPSPSSPMFKVPNQQCQHKCLMIHKFLLKLNFIMTL
jgi:hypothetical protein